jgi:putative ABC transport system permease protein
MNDLRFALRQLRKSPGFTAIAVLTLALGIGANTAIFSIIHAVLLAPIPYPNADRIVFVQEASRETGETFSVAMPNYLDWRRNSTAFEQMAITRRESRNLTGLPGREAERIPVAYVTANFFEVIGLSPRLGRTFSLEEDKAGGPAVVVLSDKLWQRAFQRDPAILGRTLTFHNQNFTVIGVMPPEMSSPQETEAWFSFMQRNPGWDQNRAAHAMLFVWGRLKPNASMEKARTELTAIAARLEKQYPETNRNLTVAAAPLLENMVGKYRTNLTLLLGAVVLVLLIACANLANLFAARGAARAREFAIRAAVGANRSRIVRQLFVESLLVALLGGSLGVCFAVWGQETLIALGPQSVERFQEIKFSWPMLGFAFGLASLTSVLFGLWPAWQTSHADLQLALKSGSQGSGDAPSARRTRDWLVIGEIALTATLLVGAGLVLKSFAHMQSLQLGYEPRGLLTARIDLPFTTYAEHAKVLNFTQSLRAKVEALPGVQSIAIGSVPPLMGGWQTPFTREGVTPPPPGQEPDTYIEEVQGDYFAALGTPLLRGRTFTEHDVKGTAEVIVINETLAERYFPGEDPIGKRLLLNPDDNPGPGIRPFEIVGVVPRMRTQGFDERAAAPLVYFPLAQIQRQSLVLLVRAGGSLRSLEKSVRDIVTSLDPAQPVFDVRPMRERVAETWSTQRLLSFLFAVFAGLALALASIGLYGVISYTALRRLREIGVRLALGAQRGDIRALILGQGMRLLLVGLILGIVGALGCSRLLRSFLFEIKPIDPIIYLGVSLLLAFAAALASWLPARRAARIDPIITLRAE